MSPGYSILPSLCCVVLPFTQSKCLLGTVSFPVFAVWFHLSHRSSVFRVLYPSQSLLCGSIFHTDVSVFRVLYPSQSFLCGSIFQTDVSVSRVLCPSQSLLCGSIFHKHASCKLFLGYFILPSVCCVVPSFALMCHSSTVSFPVCTVWFHFSRRCKSQVSLAVVLDLSQICLCHSISCKCLVG